MSTHVEVETSSIPRRGTLGAVRWGPLLAVFVFLFVLIVPAVFAPLLAPHPPLEGSLSERLQPPFWTQGGSTDHILGTDKTGRDVLSRIIYGARTSLMLSLAGVLLGAVVGSTLGIMAGYSGGLIDSLVMRVVDIAFSLPVIVLALVVSVVMTPSLVTVIIVLAILLWSRYARQVRAETLSIKERDFVLLARIAGCSRMRIMARHILPNVMNTILVIATLQVGWAILVAASLSFLGVGVPRPTPEWGAMVADGRDLILSAWWLSMFPGAAIFLTVFSINYAGDWLRDKLDPALRQI